MAARDFKSQIGVIQGLSGTLCKECLDQYSSGFTGFGTLRDKGGYFW
jgi:hypothetical protein